MPGGTKLSGRSRRLAVGFLVSLASAAMAGVIVLLVEYGVVQRLFGGSATENVRWTTTGTSTDIAGAYAEGEVRRGSDERIHLVGRLQDTHPDGKGTALIISVAHGDRVEEVTDYNTGGANHSIDIGMQPTGRSFPDTIKSISVRECLTAWADETRTRLVLDRCGTTPALIWPAS
ncbi:hypothetical protein MOQ72_04640 [Saccharopolyspora sp. K220]|uniref:hypothetical protein n=1 Tax=Saccharopolyspora soli TaxID=2926618 RepID=UPI001F57D737|nr:hypothetical protein [Saccharopolyspora soli]MCI2416701.1 hypothetical protein [Saccharopolyspora soli]